MEVRIGHASGDENGSARGGAAGDQTGKEVCVRTWYQGGWEFLARAKDGSVAEEIAAACEAACANGCIGYDQNQRNTLNERAGEVNYRLADIKTACETDCSAFIAVCVQASGVEVPYSGGNAPTTGTLKAALSGTGAFEILTGERYLSDASNLRRGDILVKPGKHGVIVLDNSPSAVTVSCAAQLPLLKKGSSCAAVKSLQLLLVGFGFDCGSYGADGEFGGATEKAVKAFQKTRGLSADGQVGEKTWSAILGIG